MTRRKKESILVVDDEKPTRDGLKIGLESAYQVYLAGDAESAVPILQERDVAVMLADLRMPGMDGLELMKLAKKISPRTQVILFTAYGTIDNAVEAMKQGAFNYLTKPVKLDEVEVLVRQAIERQQLVAENIELRERLHKKYGFENILGNSEKMTRVFETITQVAPTRANVLIEGESGTGKELIANAIHTLSPRRDGPFVTVHCAALAKTLLESELFGHDKGAFTGAVASKAGKLERADGGTFFLDEVSEIDLDIQVKLLRVLETWQFERVGGTRTIRVDVRLVTATNRTLIQLVHEGRFREDLYYRLNVVTIAVPPLRERNEDIPILVKAFVSEAAAANNKTVSGVEPKVIEAFQAYEWPGNVRELKNVIESLIVFARSEEIRFDDLPSHLKEPPPRAPRVLVGAAADVEAPAGERRLLVPEGTSLQEAERLLIEETLRNTNFNISEAARILNISRRTLHRKINEFKIRPSEPKAEEGEASGGG